MWRIALQILFHDRAKYISLVAGIAFATLLIVQQAAIFWNALRQTVSTVTDIPAADLWVARPEAEAIDFAQPMRETDVLRVRGVSGVAWAVPLYQGTAVLRSGALLRTVTVVGLDDATLVGAPQRMVHGTVADLRGADAVIMDEVAFRQYWPGREPAVGGELEIGKVRVRVAGLCRASPQFSGLGVVYARRTLAARLARDGESGVTHVLAGVAPGADPAVVAAEVSRATGLSALPVREFKARTIDYYVKYSGIAENFGVTIALGFIVGIGIVGQTFYLFSVENLKQFAALKAIGVANARLLGMVLLQGVVVAFIGFGVGAGAAAAFFAMAHDGTSGLRGMVIPPEILGGGAVAVFAMVLASSVLSAHKVLTVDPAIVFRG